MDIAFADVKITWKNLIKSLPHYDIYKNNIEQLPSSILENIFQAFKYFEIENTKVIIFGQDRYPNTNIVNGLAFGIKGNSISPSLKKIIECLNYFDICDSIDISLESWAIQGVLLLNTYLTSKEDKYWEQFIEEFIIAIDNMNLTNKITVFLWGNTAKKLEKYMKRNFIIKTFSHPSPLNRYNNYNNDKNFKFCTHFQETKELINWTYKKSDYTVDN